MMESMRRSNDLLREKFSRWRDKFYDVIEAEILKREAKVEEKKLTMNDKCFKCKTLIFYGSICLCEINPEIYEKVEKEKMNKVDYANLGKLPYFFKELLITDIYKEFEKKFVKYYEKILKGEK
jgi:hypothetical protein